MSEIENIITSTLFFIGLLISLIVPLPIKEEYRLTIITMIIISFLAIILSKFNKRLVDIEEESEDIDKRFKTIEELNDIRLDIKELKRKVFEK
ncbi:MAG: hypothetical protein WC867_00025 [Candidatus Pacearchaeota archaeon]|jgi:Na+/melibiose symporter-like transporter